MSQVKNQIKTMVHKPQDYKTTKSLFKIGLEVDMIDAINVSSNYFFAEMIRHVVMFFLYLIIVKQP